MNLGPPKGSDINLTFDIYWSVTTVNSLVYEGYKLKTVGSVRVAVTQMLGPCVVQDRGLFPRLHPCMIFDSKWLVLKMDADLYCKGFRMVTMTKYKNAVHLLLITAGCSISYAPSVWRCFHTRTPSDSTFILVYSQGAAQHAALFRLRHGRTTATFISGRLGG